MKKHTAGILILLAWLITSHQSAGFKAVGADTYTVSYPSWCSIKAPAISSQRYKFTDEITGTAMIIPVQGATLTAVEKCK